MKQPNPNPQNALPIKALAKKKAAKRTDAAGRSGMGESSSSYITGPRGDNRARSSAAAAYNKAEAAAKPTSRRGETGQAAYDKTYKGAQDYASKRKQEMFKRGQDIKNQKFSPAKELESNRMVERSSNVSEYMYDESTRKKMKRQGK
jgi:hypothetical protein